MNFPGTMMDFLIATKVASVTWELARNILLANSVSFSVLRVTESNTEVTLLCDRSSALQLSQS